MVEFFNRSFFVSFCSVELQVMDYQTQQYRVLVSLASAYAFSFTAWTFKKMLTFITQKGFQSVNPSDLAKVLDFESFWVSNIEQIINKCCFLSV